MDNKQNKFNNSKYKNGEKYTYNRFEDTFGDAGRYSDETPRKTLFLGKLHWKIVLVVVSIVTLGSVAFAVLMSLGNI